VHETLIDPGSSTSYAAAINNLGDIVGTDGTGAFLRDSSGVHVLPPPPGVDAIQPAGINDRGDILVQSFFPPYRTYLRRGGQWIFIADGEAAGLNERGQALVQVDGADGSPESLILWDNGHSTAIKAPGVRGQISLTRGFLNQVGQVAFSARAAGAEVPIEGWLWTAGRYSRLPALADGASAQVESLNDLGEVAGESGDTQNPTEHVAVTWQHGNVRKLAVPPGTSNLNDGAANVNDRGQVVGTNDTPDNFVEQAVLWNGTTAPATPLAPSFYAGARQINESGQVLIGGLVATGAGMGHNEALVWRNGGLADLGAGVPIGQNEPGQVIVDLNTGPNGPVRAALFTIDWS
jgi:uncharacterized membrane protein